MILSPFTPLFFSERKTDGIESPYIQTFSTKDTILVEMFDSSSASTIDIKNTEDVSINTLYLKKWVMDDGTTLKFVEFSLPEGYYMVDIPGLGNSDVFRVTDDPMILKDTTLIQYSMDTNRHRQDAVFFIDGMQYFFSIRMPGGFKDSNWTFGVESEQFTTDTSDIVQLYGLESTQKRFTLGMSEGCPIHFGEMLNRILCCTYVYFDGERYTRKDASVPEVAVQLEGVNSFVFTQTVQKVINLNPTIEEQNRLVMRRLNSSTTQYRKITNNIIRKV